MEEGKIEEPAKVVEADGSESEEAEDEISGEELNNNLL